MTLNPNGLPPASALNCRECHGQGWFPTRWIGIYAKCERCKGSGIEPGERKEQGE